MARYVFPTVRFARKKSHRTVTDVKEDEKDGKNGKENGDGAGEEEKEEGNPEGKEKKARGTYMREGKGVEPGLHFPFYDSS